ncbi:hypothetical protein [uncultured Gammaproteobacteria bacterium]|nr:hypothetical protein [uncultured Gammaproteobacteria bacterium]
MGLPTQDLKEPLKAYRGLKLFILTCLIRGLNLKIIFIID